MSNSSAEVVIAANSLSRSYKDVQALKSLNIEVRRGEIFGFLGPNGAGKTTFVKLMLDFIAPSSGEIEILGDSPARLNRARIGYLPERVSIHPFLTGRELMIYRGHLLGLEPASIQGRADEVLKEVHLEDAAHRRIATYSKGMQQRVGLGLALMGRPELLILDEPSSGLDPIGISQVREIMQAQRKQGVTIFFNSHQLLEVEKTCDRVGILNKGTLVAQGASAQLSTSRGVRFQLENINDDIVSYVHKLDSKASVDGNSVVMTVEDLEEERKLPARLVEKGGRLIKYEQRTESLEDIFHRLIANSDN